MLRSMYAGVSGLRSHQTMMDVVGNNIANVNTAGYKSTRVTFQESLTQVIRGAGSPVGADPADPQLAGTNPLQLGLGVRVAAVDGVFTQGASQLTSRATDLAIQGEGFFVVRVSGEQLYTRAGAFSFDAAGTLNGPGGQVVMGYDRGADPATAPLTPVQINVGDFSDVSIGADGSITGRANKDDATDSDGTTIIPNPDPTTATAAGGYRAGQIVQLGYVALANFDNAEGLTRVGNSLFAASVNSGPVATGIGAQGEFGTIQNGLLEMSNVDLSQEFTNLIVAQRGFQANARTITTSDEMLQELVNLKR